MTKTYLVECFCPGVTKAAHAATSARAGAAAHTLRAAGCDIWFLDSVLVPADEVAFYRFAAPSAADVERASALADLPVERVLEYIHGSGTPRDMGGPTVVRDTT